jgi:c(7)-type cytochrome triheme protein
MKFKILLPVLLATLAVGFLVLHRDTGVAEGLGQEAAAQESAEADAGTISVSDGSEAGVPPDICYSGKVESVVFSHQKHAVELGFDCSTCHTGIFQMDAKSVESQPDFDMSGLNAGKYCGSCHSSTSNVAFSTESNCAWCHRGVRGAEQDESTGEGEG